MKNQLYIYPFGDFSYKLMSLIGALQLQEDYKNNIGKNSKNSKKSKKNQSLSIELIYSLQLNDLFFDKTYFMNELPPFDFPDISYSYLENKEKTSSYILNSLLNYEFVEKHIKKISKKENLSLHNYGIIENSYPFVKQGIIYNTYLNGFKSKGASLLKKWLSNITYFKCYSNFMSEIGFNWYDPHYEYVSIYLNIGNVLNEIRNNINTNKFILTPEFYENALQIIKQKSKKPLQILFFYNLDIDFNYLFRYMSIFKKYGNIIDINNMIPQVYKLLIQSKVDHYIGCTNFSMLSSFLYAEKNSITIVNSNENVNFKYNPKNFPDGWIFLNDISYRIIDNRGLEEYKLNLLSNIKTLTYKDQYEISKKMYETRKDAIKEIYQKYYLEYDKNVKNTFLKNLLLYRVYFYQDTFYLLNSNININEGILLFQLIKKYKPKKLLEIGFACGVSAAFMLCALSKKDELTSVDPFQKIQWNSFGLNVVKQILKEQKLSAKNHHWEGKYSKTFFESTSNKYDFMLIDGDHSYEGTMIDLLGANKVLNKNGILAVDDSLHFSVKKALNDFIGIQNNIINNTRKNNKLKYKLIKQNVKTMNIYQKQY